MPSNHISNKPYHDWLAEKNKGLKAPRDRCVLCGVETVYSTKMPVEYRDYYDEGCGQLCKVCWDLTGENPVPHPD